MIFRILGFILELKVKFCFLKVNLLETAGFAKEGPWGNCISKNLTEMKGQEDWERVEESAGGRRGRRGRCREEWTQERISNVGPWTVWGAEEA